MKTAQEARDEFEKALAVNIGLLAKRLQEAGYTLLEFDKIGADTLKFIQDKAEKATANNPLQAKNVENLIIMVFMHGALTSQKDFINSTAASLGVTKERVIAEMEKDTIGVPKK